MNVGILFGGNSKEYDGWCYSLPKNLSNRLLYLILLTSTLDLKLGIKKCKTLSKLGIKKCKTLLKLGIKKCKIYSDGDVYV